MTKLGRPVLAHVLYHLAKPHLGDDISLEILRDGLLELPSPWLSESSLVRSPEARDAILVLSYCNALVSPNSPLGTADRLPLFGAKAALLLLGCAEAEDSEQVTRLLLRWAPAAHLIFTPHPNLLAWIFKRSFAPLEFRTACVRKKLESTMDKHYYVAEWLDRGETASTMEENLVAYPSSLNVLLEVVQGDRRPHVAHKALRVILQVASASIRDHVIEQLWLRLPRLLQQPITGDHGHALLLQLAVQLGTPADPDVLFAVVAPLCVLLPSLVTQCNPGPWASLARNAAFSVARLLINTARDARTAAGLHGLLQDSKFLRALETEVNEREVSEMRRVALKVVCALLALRQRLGVDAPQASGTVLLDSFTLITALEGASASSSTPEQKLSLAALQLIAHLPDPCVQDVDPGGYVNLQVSSTTEFISALYVTLHYVQGMRHGDVMELAGWNALQTVIGWSEARTIVCVPWTHTLLWDTPVPRDTEVAQAMLFFTRDWARLLDKIQGKEATPSKTRLLNTTVEHLLTGADTFANLEACLVPFIETISACLRLEHELSPKTAKIARSKLEELRLRM
ncbi:hypothetical protein B566_EDAN010346 [Ephemera danica]|nr:hypothetical protein B566_EDAN010346 [Ephemera danica]